MKTFFTFLFFIFSASALFSQARFIPPDPSKVDSRLHGAATKNNERQAALEALFKQVGCETGLSEQAVKSAKTPNVICTLPGESDEEIVIGAHYDKVSQGRGVVDNWSGASLLPTLFESLHGEKRHHTLVFIGFTNEEEGEVGSAFYVSKLKKRAWPKSPRWSTWTLWHWVRRRSGPVMLIHSSPIGYLP